MERNDDMTTSPLDRRNFLKKAGAASALGVTTPLIVQSVTNPAAACSGTNLAAQLAVTGQQLTNGWNADTDTAGGNLATAFPAIARANNIQRHRSNVAFNVQSNDLVLVAWTIDWRTGTAPSATALAVDALGSPIPGLTFAAADRIEGRYDDNAGASRGWMGVLWAQNTSNAAINGVHIIITYAQNRSDNFAGQVVLIRDTANPLATPDVNRLQVGGALNVTFPTAATSRTVTVPSFTGGNNPSSAEFLVTAGLVTDTNLNDPNTGTWTAPAYDDMTASTVYSDETGALAAANPEVVLSSFFSTTPVATKAASLSLGGVLTSPPSADLSAIALEIIC